MKSLNNTMLDYEELVRENLKVKNPALLKTGVLGTLINIMSHIKYDSAMYYQRLLRELNPATAEDFNSILFHSAILDYKIEYAKPATCLVNIVIPESIVKTTQTVTYNLDRDTQLIDENGYWYTLEEDIKIYATHNTVSAERLGLGSSSGLEINKIPNPLKTTENIYLIEYPGLKQYKREFQILSVPDYEIGTDINHTINIDSYKNIYEINVYLQGSKNYLTISEEMLKIRNSDEIISTYKLSKLNVKYNKFNATQFDTDIYLSVKDNQLVFTYGNGINGQKLQADQKLIFEIKTTMGSVGNINSVNIIAPNVLVVSVDDGGYTQSYKSNLKILSSTGGQNGQSIASIYDIRNTMIRKANTRKTIVTLNDFQSEFTLNGFMPFVDIKYFNSKNNVFIYNIIKDSSQKIVKTTTMHMKETNFSTNLFFPEYNYKGLTLISPFYYKQKFNYYIAYMVRPLIEITLISNSNVSNITVLNNNITLQVLYDYFERKTKIRVINNNALNTYIIKSNQFEITLNKNNNFEQVVNQRFLDKYCLFENEVKDITVDILNLNNLFVMQYYSNDIVYQLVEKQKHFMYTELNRLNPSISNNYVLNIPAIDNYYFKSTSGRNIYTQLDEFFNAIDKQSQMSYNMDVHQSFFNTIDLPDEYRSYVVKLNSNGDLLDANNSVILNVIIDKAAYNLSDISSVEELEFKIKALTYGLLLTKEGFGVDYYETELEKIIYDNINIFKNIEVLSPKAFTIYDSREIYTNLEADLGRPITLNGVKKTVTILDLVKFIPTYFHYDYDNIKINIEFV